MKRYSHGSFNCTIDTLHLNHVQQVRLTTELIMVPLPAKLDALTILDLVNSVATIPVSYFLSLHR